MRKLIFIFLLMSSSFAYAQDGAFLEASYGLGFGNKTNKKVYRNEWENNRSVGSYNAQLLIGRRRNNWIFNTGFSFFKTGYRPDNLYAIDPIYGTLKYVEADYYFSVPLKIGYEIRLSKNLYVIPYLGSGLTIMTKSISAYSDNSGTGSIISKPLTSGLFFLTQTYLRYQLNKKFSLIAGAEFQYLPAKLNVDEVPGTYYNLTFNAGFQYHYVVKHAAKHLK